MERGKAIQLIRDIDLRLAFLGVDLEATPAGSKPIPHVSARCGAAASAAPADVATGATSRLSHRTLRRLRAATDAHGKEPS